MGKRVTEIYSYTNERAKVKVELRISAPQRLCSGCVTDIVEGTVDSLDLSEKFGLVDDVKCLDG